MKRKSLLLALLLTVALSSTVLWSDDDEDEEEEHEGRGKESKMVVKGEVKFVAGKSDFPVVTNAKWKAECGSCHMLFLPGLLPARSWTKMMTGLDKHFGENAELDDATRKEITEFLEKNSADKVPTRRGIKMISGIGKNDAPLRISETSYFIKKHDEIAASVYKRKAIGSASNCIACHGGAEEGRFGEREIRIPKVDEVLKKKVEKKGP